MRKPRRCVRKTSFPFWRLKQNKTIEWKKKLYDCLVGVPASFLKNTLRKSKGKNDDAELMASSSD